MVWLFRRSNMLVACIHISATHLHARNILTYGCMLAICLYASSMDICLYGRTKAVRRWLRSTATTALWPCLTRPILVVADKEPAPQSFSILSYLYGDSKIVCQFAYYWWFPHQKWVGKPPRFSSGQGFCIKEYSWSKDPAMIWHGAKLGQIRGPAIARIVVKWYWLPNAVRRIQ